MWQELRHSQIRRSCNVPITRNRFRQYVCTQANNRGTSLQILAANCSRKNLQRRKRQRPCSGTPRVVFSFEKTQMLQNHIVDRCKYSQESDRCTAQPHPNPACSNQVRSEGCPLCFSPSLELAIGPLPAVHQQPPPSKPVDVDCAHVAVLGRLR
jgi:hypothetical protein